jgi:3-phosphoshikimate 1-carboxyvinyltransferase
MLIAGAIAGKVTVTGLDAFTTQGDKSVLQALMEAGAHLSIESSKITVAPARLSAFHFNATDTPDLFPPLAALACYASGTSVIEGICRLQHKESNRAVTITEELAKLGADISLQDDYMIIRGHAPLYAANISSRNDHRIAMMCAIAALGAKGPITIADAGAVNKSYPAFFKDLRGLGARIEVSE